MPLSNEALEKRLLALENKELKVTDLPIAALKKKLAQETTEAQTLILPGSVTSDLLSDELTDHTFGIQGPLASALAVQPSVTSLLKFTVPTEGIWFCTYSADTEPNAGYLVMQLVHPELGFTQMVSHANAAGFRFPTSSHLIGRVKAGTTFELAGFMTTGGAGVVQISYMQYFKIGP